jgi:hypothetical protein
MGATNRALATDLPITLVTVCQLVSLYVKFVGAQFIAPAWRAELPYSFLSFKSLRSQPHSIVARGDRSGALQRQTLNKLYHWPLPVA